MIDRALLKDFENTDITKTDKSQLEDIRDIKIDSSLPADERLASFISQIKNPYCFLCDGMAVKIRFLSEKPLEKALGDYFLSLK